MKNFCTSLIFLLGMFFISCSGDNNEPELPGDDDTDTPVTPDGEIDYSKVGLEYDDGKNIIFHVKLAIDKEGWDMRGEEFFKTRLKTQWEQINERFNKLDKKGELKRNYIFVPDLDDIIIYENDEATQTTMHWGEMLKKYPGCLDYNKFQVMVSYDFVIQSYEVGKGGGCGDIKGLSTILVINPGQENLNKFTDYFEDSKKTVESITHELGHARGIWDLYVVNFGGSNNQVNGKGFSATPGVMNNNTYDPLEKCNWNEYEILCLNANLAKMEKSGVCLWNTCMREYFADQIEISVTENNAAVEDCTLNFYKYADYKIDNKAEKTRAAAGGTARMDAYELFWDGKTSAGGWALMFLVEAVNNKTGHKGYHFMPYYEPHTQGLKDKSANPISGKSTLKVAIDIPSK